MCAVRVKVPYREAVHLPLQLHHLRVFTPSALRWRSDTPGMPRTPAAWAPGLAPESSGFSLSVLGTDGCGCRSQFPGHSSALKHTLLCMVALVSSMFARGQLMASAGHSPIDGQPAVVLSPPWFQAPWTTWSAPGPPCFLCSDVCLSKAMYPT